MSWAIPVEKLIAKRLIIDNPINFCSDIKQNLLKLLRLTFVGKCYAGGCIVKIVKIENYSDCEMVSANISAQGQIDVNFIAAMVIITNGDLIIGAKIIQRTELVCAKYVHTFEDGFQLEIMITLTGFKEIPRFAQLISGDFLFPIYVVAVKTIAMATIHPIIVIGKILSYIPRPYLYYRLTREDAMGVSIDDRAVYSKLIGQITEARKERATLDLALVNRFEGYLYSQKPAKGWLYSSILESLDAIDIIGADDAILKPGIMIERAPDIPKTAPLIRIINKRDAAIMMLTVPVMQFKTNVLVETLRYLIAINQMVALYKDKLESHTPLFAIILNMAGSQPAR